MRRMRLEPNEELFVQGEPGDSLALVSHGMLGVFVRNSRGHDEQIDAAEPGDVVGEMACVDPAPRSATVIALQPSLVHLLDRHLLAYLRREAPSLVAAVVGSVIAQLTDRLRATDERIERELRRMAGGASGPSEPAPRLPPGPPPTRHVGKLHLVDLDPLQGLADADLVRLSSVAPARVWEDRALLCHEGDRGASCFFVVAGEVDVVRTMRGKRRRLATLPSGCLVGQAALVDSAPRSASLRARGTVIALELDRATFERLLSRASPLALRFQEEIAIQGIRQLRSATSRLAKVLGKTDGRAKTATSPKPKPAQEPLDFIQASLSEWGMKVEDLENIEVVTPDGLPTGSELSSRKRGR